MFLGTKMIFFMKKIYEFLLEVINKFVKDGCSIYAAALTYVTLLALVPFFIIFIKILSFFQIFKVFIHQIEGFIFQNFIANSANAIQNNISKFVEKGGQLSTLSLIALVFTLVLVVINVVIIFDKIWHIKEKKQTLSLYLKYTVSLILFPIAIGSILAVSNYFLLLPYFSKITLIFPELAVFLAFFCLYYFTPNCKVNIYSAGLTAFIVLLLFWLTKALFSVYITHFSNYQFLYGIFSIIPIFLIWIYTIWIIILLGVVINVVISKHFFQKSNCMR